MMNEEKRIVTFMGASGKRIANIIWKEKLNMFKVECIFPNDFKVFALFESEGDAQTYAEQFAFKEKHGTI